MAEVRVNINGVQVISDSGKTILQAVRENGLDEIPTLCYEERLGFITSCFLCVVEVEGARGLAPSCSTMLNNGMVILTRSPKVLEARKTCLELLFSDHYADCISPCALECPAGVDIQGYMSLVKKGFYREAVELIKEKNPMPIVCGRVCVRLCEVACRRNLLDEPVGIDFLKRYAAESAEGKLFNPAVKSPTGKTVAIVGAGPAGLSAAYYLAVEGHNPVIFEAMPEAGGMLRYGIPAYRLPKELLDEEIDSIRRLGVEIHCGKKIGIDFTLAELKARFDTVLLAMGAWGASGMRIDNENAPGVLSGLDVLRRTINGGLKEIKGRVLVVGGGNTAIDVSRTAVRLGASETVIVYRRTESEMPAHHEEIAAARKEGVQMAFLTAPVRVVTGENGAVTGLECLRMELGAPDSSGRPRPVPVEGSNYVEPCDYIIAAIGQYPDFAYMGKEGEGVSLHRWGGIIADKDTLETSIPGVYSAGDAVTGPATVIEGIAAGRRAAYAIHSKFTGNPSEAARKDFVVKKNMFNPVSCEELQCFKCSPRHEMPERDPAERVKDFQEVELGLSRMDTGEEAERCFQCGCLEVDECLLRKYGDEYGAEPSRFPGDVNRYEADLRHPFILIDSNKCIKCGRCVKTCEAILGSSALGFVNRGFASVVKPALEKPLIETNCVSCGNCIDSCPTGALSENFSLMARIGDRVKNHAAVCSFCSVGCRIEIKSFGRDMRIRSLRDKNTGSGDYLCLKGRFGSRYLNADDRIIQPAFGRDGRIHYCEWDQAISKTAEKLGGIRKKYGADSIAVFTSPKLTGEEIFAASVLAKEALETGIIGSFADITGDRNRHEIDHILGYTVSANPMDDVFNADVILLLNADVNKTHPSFGWKIREARRRGAKLITVNSNRIDLARDSQIWLQPRKGTSTFVIAALMREIIGLKAENREFIEEITHGFGEFSAFLAEFETNALCRTAGVSAPSVREAASLLSENNPRIIAVYDFGSRKDRAAGDLQALTDLLLLTGNLGSRGRGLIIMDKHANSTGLCDMGAEPGYKTGRIRDDAEPHNIREMLLSDRIKGALVIGEDPLENPANLRFFRGLEFLAVADIFMTETTSAANVIMPASTHIESGGSFTGSDRRVRRFESACNPPGGKTNLEIINDLAEGLGKNIGFRTPDEAFEAIRKTNALCRNINPDKPDQAFWNPDPEALIPEILYSRRFETPDGKARFSAFPLESGSFSADIFNYNAIESVFSRRIKKLLTTSKPPS